MPRNGSGTYSLPAGNPVVTGTTISSSGWANPTLTDIAAAITASIAVDGQTAPTANLPMGNFRHLNVANGQNTNEYATVGQIQSAGLKLLGSSTVGPMSLSGLTVIQSANSDTNFTVDGSSNIYGAALRLIGNGVTTPNKFIRSNNGAYTIYNSADTVNIFNLDDSGNLSVPGSISSSVNITASGNITATGTVSGSNITGTSDERLKEGWQPMDRDFLIRMSKVLHGTFSWKADGLRSAGVGAASLREAFPEAVHEDARGMLSAAYGHAALVTVLELIPIVLRLLDAHGETP